MTEDKRLTYRQIMDLIEEVYNDYFRMFRDDKMEFRDFAILENVLIKIQEKLKEGKPESKRKEFQVKYDMEIKSFLVTNDYYFIALESEIDASTVCNMLNQILSDVE